MTVERVAKGKAEGGETWIGRRQKWVRHRAQANDARSQPLCFPVSEAFQIASDAVQPQGLMVKGNDPVVVRLAIASVWIRRSW